MNKEINQEYVDYNIDNIIEFMAECRPDAALNGKKNWKKALLKDYTVKIDTVIAYQKYKEGVNMVNNYTTRVNRFYDKEQELEERAMREESILKKYIAHNENWRHITQAFRGKIISETSINEYQQFLEDNKLMNFPSYYGL
jgi:hypothetical protein